MVPSPKCGPKSVAFSRYWVYCNNVQIFFTSTVICSQELQFPSTWSLTPASSKVFARHVFLMSRFRKDLFHWVSFGTPTISQFASLLISSLTASPDLLWPDLLVRLKTRQECLSALISWAIRVSKVFSKDINCW